MTVTAIAIKSRKYEQEARDTSFRGVSEFTRVGFRNELLRASSFGARSLGRETRSKETLQFNYRAPLSQNKI